MINFPNAPAVNEVFTYGSLSWAWDGEKWVLIPVASKYIIGCFVPSVPQSNQVLLNHPFAIAVTIPADFGPYDGHNSYAKGTVAATAATVIAVHKNGTGVGTITIGAGSANGTFATSGNVMFAAGDTMTLVAPAAPDASFAGFSATLVGYES